MANKGDLTACTNPKCRKQFVPKKDSGRKYCGLPCYHEHMAPPIVECASPVCKNMFKARRVHGRRQKYCSKRCINLKNAQKECANPECTNKVKKQENRFCCKSCYTETQSGTTTRRNNDTGVVEYIKPPEPPECKVPGCTNLVTGRQRVGYCSRECSYKARIKWPEKKCKCCGNMFKPRRRDDVISAYCSSLCVRRDLAAQGRFMSLFRFVNADNIGQLKGVT